MTEPSPSQLNLKLIGSAPDFSVEYSIAVLGGVTSCEYSSAPCRRPKLPSANSIVESWPSLTSRVFGAVAVPHEAPWPPFVPGPAKHGWKPTCVRVIAPVVGLTEIRCAPA